MEPSLFFASEALDRYEYFSKTEPITPVKSPVASRTIICNSSLEPPLPKTYEEVDGAASN